MIGDALRALRSARGWTQFDLATRSGVSRKQISNLEAGQSANLKQTTIERLAGAFSLSVPQFMAALGIGEEPPAGLRDVISDKQVRQLLTLWPSLNEADKVGFLAQIKAIAELRRQYEDSENARQRETEPPEYIARLHRGGKATAGK